MHEEENVEDVFNWEVSKDHGNIRIDKFLTQELQSYGFSRSQVQQWIRQEQVAVNASPVKSNYKLNDGDKIELTIPESIPVETLPESIPLDVVYEDHDVIVINKPRGMVVHPAAGHASGTMVNALLHHCQDLSGIGGEIRPGIVHRIDKDTSGLIVAAKNDKAHRSLSEQFKAHTVERKYIAIVHGRPEHEQGSIDAPIGRHPSDRKKFAVTETNSKTAKTHFVVIDRFRDAAVLELKLETGRTHQIRVHMKFIGHPIVGDPMYSQNRRKRIEGQALHAAVIGFQHPSTNEFLRFESPLPDDIKELIRYFKNSGV